MQQQSDTILQSDTIRNNGMVSDSIVSDTALAVPSTFESLQKKSLLLFNFTEEKPVNPPGEPGIPIVRYQNNTLFGLCLAVFIFFTIIRFSFKNYLHLAVSASRNYQIANILFLEKNMRNLRGSILLNTFFFFNISLFIFEFYNFYYLSDFREIHIAVYFNILAIVLVIYFLKMIILFSLGFVFNGIKEAREYLNTTFVYNKNTAIFLLPITLSVPFIVYNLKPFLFYSGLFIMLFFFIYRLFRGVKILFRKHVSIFYMILYLCALEILPMLVIIKILKSLA